MSALEKFQALVDEHGPMCQRLDDKAEARALYATGEPVGYSLVVASGDFLGGRKLPSGEHVDCYMSFGHTERFFLVSANYRPAPNFNDRWR